MKQPGKLPLGIDGFDPMFFDLQNWRAQFKAALLSGDCVAAVTRAGIDDLAQITQVIGAMELKLDRRDLVRTSLPGLWDSLRLAIDQNTLFDHAKDSLRARGFQPEIERIGMMRVLFMILQSTGQTVVVQWLKDNVDDASILELHQVNHRLMGGQVSLARFLSSQIDAGFFDTLFLAEVVPRVYEAQFGSEIKQDSYKEILKGRGIQRLAWILAMSPAKVESKVMKGMSIPIPGLPGDVYLDEKFFKIEVRADGGKDLVFSEYFYQWVVSLDLSDHFNLPMYTMCPAANVDGKDPQGKIVKVITALIRYCVDLMIKHYVPLFPER